MATETMNPEAAQQVKVSLSETEITDLVHKVRESEEHRGEWIKNQQRYYRRRIGLRGEKTYPWPDCANFSIPTDDRSIRRQKPIYVSSVWGVRPVFSVENVKGDTERARRIESFYDYLMHNRMKGAKLAVTHAVDGMLESGFSFIKCHWCHNRERISQVVDVEKFINDAKAARELPRDFKRGSVKDEELDQMLMSLFELDPQNEEDFRVIQQAKSQFRSGAKKIKISMGRTSYNAPKWTHVRAPDLVVPWDSKGRVEDVPWLCHLDKKLPQELKQLKKDKSYDAEAVDEVLMLNNREQNHESSIYAQQLAQDKDLKEGIHTARGDSNYIEVWELYFWHDIDGDGCDERCVLTIAPDTGKALRLIELPYFHGKWPFVKLTFEEREDRWYSSRGIPELLWDLSTIINTMHNSWIDARTIQNARTLKIKHTSPAAKNPTSQLFKPGGYFLVRNQDDVEELGTQIMDFTYERLESNARNWAETYIGIADQNLVSNGGRVERRTAAEVDEISKIGDEIVELDLTLFQNSMVDLHLQTLALWAQYGDDNVSIETDSGNKPIVFDKGDLYMGYDIIPVGTLRNSSARARANTAMEAMQISTQPAFAPFANHEEMFKDYIEGITEFRTGRRYIAPAGLKESEQMVQQVHEVEVMKLMQIIHPVQISEDHQVHIQTIERIFQNMQQAQEQGTPPEISQSVAQLLQGHVALHMAAMGDETLVKQIEQTLPFQYVNNGQTLSLVPTQQPQQ